MAAGDAAGAEACYRQALALDPDFSEALTNLGLLREKSGTAAEAEACYRRAIALNPRCIENHLNLALLLLNGRRFAEAEAESLQAIRLAPRSPQAWSNFGVILACMQRENEAERCYRTALGLDDAHAGACFNLAYILLRQGRLAEGWAYLEARQWYEVFERHFACPRWRGEPIGGKSLMVVLEAGHGDMIQFCRYLPLLRTQGAARLGLVCHPGLETLFATLPGVDTVFSVADDVPAHGWDYWSPPMSLPHYCGTRLDNIPAQIPYLAAEAQRLAAWQATLPGGKLRVGLVWKGNPLFENDAERSLPSLNVLSPLATVDGVCFVSLQKGEGETEALHPPPGLPLKVPERPLQDFADTAALVSCLDLVISVDTAVAHLAGALGKPCWVLLPDYKTDWRWLTGRSDSPWYPGVLRLFRQPAGGGWEPVVANLVSALQTWKDDASGDVSCRE